MNLSVLCFISAVCFAKSQSVCNNELCGTNHVPGENSTSSRLLSRRKRFLIFPDGSSLQLVFCCQTAAVIPIGDIFLFGNTAALAWNLPTDPDFLLMLKKYEKQAHRRGNEKHILYFDEDGKFLAKAPYTKRPIINPAFAKRSIDSLTYKEKLKMRIDRTKMHEMHKKSDFLKEHLDEKSVEFHRNSRVGLLEKIESLITALGADGRQCVLRKLCETSKNANEQGTFLQELLRVVFTLPKGKEFDLEEHREYDESNSRTNCAAAYPGCEELGVPGEL